VLTANSITYCADCQQHNVLCWLLSNVTYCLILRNGCKISTDFYSWSKDTRYCVMAPYILVCQCLCFGRKYVYTPWWLEVMRYFRNCWRFFTTCRSHIQGSSSPVTQCTLVVSYRPFGTTYRYHLQGSRPWNLVDGTHRLSRNIGSQLPIYTAQHLRKARISFIPRLKPEIAHRTNLLSPKRRHVFTKPHYGIIAH